MMDRLETRLRRAVKDLVVVCLGIGAFLVIDGGAEWILTQAGITFPSFVLAMVALFIGMTLGRRVDAAAVDRFASFCAPAASFLGRWMALFFVPPLVLVPAGEAPQLRTLVLLIVVGVVGFVVSFWLGGTLARPRSDRLGSEPLPPRAEPLPGWPRQVILNGFFVLSILGAGATWLSRDPRAAVLFGVALSVFSFSAAEAFRDGLMLRGFRVFAAFCHPVLVCAAIIALLWRAMGLELDQYLTPWDTGVSAGGVLSFLLRPAVVSLACALYAERSLMKRHAMSLLLSTGCSAGVSLFFTAGLAGVLGMSPPYARAIVSRSVTTPVALSLAELLGASGGLTAMIVILTGVLGALFAKTLGRVFGFDSPFILGVATGVSSHGIGTAALARKDTVASAFSGIAFALVATFSALFVSIRFVRDVLLAVLS